MVGNILFKKQADQDIQLSKGDMSGLSRTRVYNIACDLHLSIILANEAGIISFQFTCH